MLKEKVGKIVLGAAGLSLAAAATLGVMALTKTGFVIINDGERGVLKTGTKYNMNELNPGYHFFMPIYQTVDVNTIRPKLINYSRTESDKEDSELLIFEPTLSGLDKKGIHIELALSIEVKPQSDQLAEMYRNDGDFHNSFYKKVLQSNRDAVQNTLSHFNVDTIMDKRAEVEKILVDLLNETYNANPYFRLVKVNLKDIVVPTEIRKKQLDVQAAKQDALKSKELIEKAKNIALSVEAQAQGKANAVKIAAEGRAQALLLEATAQAKANKLLSDSLSDKVIKIQTIEKWDGSVPTYVGSEGSQFIMDMKK